MGGWRVSGVVGRNGVKGKERRVKGEAYKGGRGWDAGVGFQMEGCLADVLLSQTSSSSSAVSFHAIFFLFLPPTYL